MIIDRNTFNRDPKIAFDIGWDYARLGAIGKHFESATADFKPVADGYFAGLEKFPNIGPRFAYEDKRFILKWLHLRLNAHKRGRVFSQGLTWEYLKTIDTPHCPITRVPFTYGQGLPTDWTIDRINNDAAYATGNVIGFSHIVNRAKGTMDYLGCLMASNKAADREGKIYHGLTENQWLRLAGFMSLNASEVNLETGLFPMAVMPITGMALENPLNFLQIHMSTLFVFPHSHEKNKSILTSFKVVDNHNLYKCLLKFADLANATYCYVLKTQKNRVWAGEDAWDSPAIRKAWMALAEKLLALQGGLYTVGHRLAALHKSVSNKQAFDAVRTEWHLDTGGYVVPEQCFSTR